MRRYKREDTLPFKSVPERELEVFHAAQTEGVVVTVPIIATGHELNRSHRHTFWDGVGKPFLDDVTSRSINRTRITGVDRLTHVSVGMTIVSTYGDACTITHGDDDTALT